MPPIRMWSDDAIVNHHIAAIDDISSVGHYYGCCAQEKEDNGDSFGLDSGEEDNGSCLGGLDFVDGLALSKVNNTTAAVS